MSESLEPNRLSRDMQYIMEDCSLTTVEEAYKHFGPEYDSRSEFVRDIQNSEEYEIIGSTESSAWIQQSGDGMYE